MLHPFAEIHLDRLRSNYRYLKNYVGDAAVLAVVKADAYGHGAVQIAKQLESENVFGFGVALYSEVQELLEAGITRPIIHLGKTHSDLIELCGAGQVRCSVNCPGDLKLIQQKSKPSDKIKVHLKVDTGMGRLGIQPDLLNEMIAELKRIPQITLEGVWSHLATAEETETDYYDLQLQKFTHIVEKIKKMQLGVKYFHLANSTAILKFPGSHFNMVRPGIALYGVTISEQSDNNLESVMELKAPLILKRRCKKGTSIGYNRTFITDDEMQIGVVQAGYADGIPVRFSNKGRVLYKNILLDIVGSVSMDMVSIDCRDADIPLNSNVTFWGGKNKNIQIKQLAKEFGMLPYEFLTGVSKRVKRVYVSAIDN